MFGGILLHMHPKAEFRLAIVQRLQHMTQREREVESQVLRRYLRDCLGTSPQTLAAFMPYIDEPDIKPLLTELLAAGWVLAMPAVQRNHLVFRRVTDLSQNVRNPVSRIVEASDDCEPVQDTDISVAIIPGRAFSSQGHRMGRGNGGYDRWIEAQRKRKPETRFIGICFDCQLVPTVPMETHDQSVDMVITSRGIVTAKRL